MDDYETKKLYKMKKYFDILSKKCLLIAGTLLLMFSSCDESVLDEVPLDFLAPENAYTTVAGVRQGISGLHWTFRNYWFWGG